MTGARLTSAMLVGAIRRLAEREQGFATVLANGDETSGAVLVQLLERGQFHSFIERFPTLDQRLEWVRVGQGIESPGHYCDKRRRTDPDLNVIELDVPDATRFIPLLPTGT